MSVIWSELFQRGSPMTKTEQVAIERELETLHTDWEARRDERDLQSAIRLENLATWTMFKIVDGGK